MSLAPLLSGTVIPAHPLALTASRHLDERRQRALTRYYLASGVGGLAVGVHTTQFAIREAGLLGPVLELAAGTIRESGRSGEVVAVAGACGPVDQAVAEASLAADLGYDAVLLSPVVDGADEAALLARARAVGEVLPVIGFYLQTAIGGPVLSREFWRALADQPTTAAIKVAPFDRYRTLDVIHGVAAADRRDEVALYTGNDDHIIGDLVATMPGGLRFRGGLLGQWAVWTRAAVAMFARLRTDPAGVAALAPGLTDANAAVFDAAHGFAGCIAGVHEVLRRQGLLDGIWCLDPDETLSPGQADELSRVTAAYPWLVDDEFVAEHRDDWLS
ncbi:dihydrodipicolinate synthase family protein [Actinophytocola xinjiangensis]|uniref:Dihydrodipicolinate synthase family protein n=1 Tax=Actinophytocola xinjiangensis TaxID=485602 RepID=A0A7Z1B035_9PSEU|nr:dihydrodipicolinate synthase family protein [Actinophytocola xinjiangensis]OLF14199.1 dihydrodipicolinate synthase family protein [Actinophytocola xinjiangensis]